MIFRRKKLRHELKYYIHHHEYHSLRHRVKMLLSMDKNSITEDGYHIRSLYFDNMHESSLYDKSDGIFQRKKYRIRIYNKSDRIIKFERKSKFNDYIAKESVGITRDQFYSILRGEIQFMKNMNDPLMYDFYNDMKIGNMKPAVIVDYVREAYIYPYSDVRVTFDKQLSASVQSFDIFDPNLVTREMITTPQTILEVKYNEFLPIVVSNLLQMSGHNRSAISKYVICKESRKVYTN